MSKDAKVGFGIGGVLLAVLVVYLVVVPRHHRVVHQPIAVVNPPAGTPPVNSASSGPLAVEMPTTAPAPSVTVAEKPADSVTPLLPPSSTPSESLTTPASPLVDASGTASAAHNGDWEKIFPSQSAPGLMAPETVAPSTHAGGSLDSNLAPASTIYVGHTSADPSVVSDAPRHVRSGESALGGRQYTVKSGETLSSIAADVYGNARYYVAIMRVNPTINPNRLRVGTKLSLPAASDVKPVSTGGSAVETTTSASAGGYDSGGAAGGGIILASQASPTIDTIVSPDAAATSDANGFYTVKKGDTLYGISKKLYGNLHEAAVIYSTNKSVIGPDKAKLKVGTVLQLPSTGAIEAAANAAQ